jgi:hypothetical protein
MLKRKEIGQKTDYRLFPQLPGVHVSRHVLDQFLVLLEQQQTPHV